MDEVLSNATGWIAGLFRKDPDVYAELKGKIIARIKKDEDLEII